MEKIRILKTKNLKEFLKTRHLLREVFPHLSKKLSFSCLKERIKWKEGMFLRAKLKNKLVGFSIWRKEAQNTAYLWWLLGFPKYQKNGFGERVLNETLLEMKKRRNVKGLGKNQK